MTVLDYRLADSGEVHQFARDSRGTTSIEYGLIAMLVAVGMLVGLNALGSGNKGSWGNTSATIADAMKEKAK